MPKISETRRKITWIIVIAFGLVIGMFLKRVSAGLLIGVVLGLLAAGISTSNRKS
ncbi:MAG: hypothetical protein ABI151_11245 [Chitinophagaceae bacterium]